MTSAPIWAATSKRVQAAIAANHGEAVLLDSLQHETLNGRPIIVALSGAKPDDGERVLRRLRAKGATRVAVLEPQHLRGEPDIVEYLDAAERNNWHVDLARIAQNVLGTPTQQQAAPINEFDAVRTAVAVMATASGPVRYCVERRIPCGLVIIGGRPKSRKSWYALQLAIAKASGGRFMHMMTAACRVLYIALEDNDRRMKQRLEFFGVAADGSSLALHLAYEWPSGIEGIEKLERWLQQFPDTKLVIIDVLQRFRGPRDPKASAYESDYQTMALLHGVTQRHDGLTILVVHHVKKGAVEDPIEAINGTFAIAGGADAFIILRRGSEPNQWIAHIDGRDWESWDHEFVWEFVPQEGWRQVGVSDGVQLTPAQTEIVARAKDSGYITPTQLAEWREISKSTAHESLQALVAKGALRVHAGKYYPIER